MTRRLLVLRILDALAGLTLLAWWLLPLLPAFSGKAANTISQTIAPYQLPLHWLRVFPGQSLGIFLFALWLLPLYTAWKLAALIIGNRMKVFGQPEAVLSSILRIVFSIIPVLAAILPVLKLSEDPAYFAALPLTGLIGTAVVLLLHFTATILFLRQLNGRSPAYREYRRYQSTLLVPAMKDAKTGKTIKQASILDLLQRIRTKLFFAFVGVIALILVTLSLLLLNNYRATILSAVSDGAVSRVDQAATSYRVNLGDYLAMDEYLRRQIELNSDAEFAWDELTIYSSLRQTVYLNEALPAGTAFEAEFSSLEPGTRYPNVEILDAALLAPWFAEAAAGQSLSRVINEETGYISFAAAITKTDFVRQGTERIAKERLLGLVLMHYDNDVIMRPYFRTRNLVYALTALFLYLSVLLTWLVGNYIVNPLLFLRMNVRKISDTLTTMIRGTSRISSSALVYNDYVNSKDEIKSLSCEISDMVTVIRGIIPYISASTLKQAESGSTSSVKKDLCFLFTDIRGFTTLCEGLAPEDVVNVLNRYLDLEAEIILSNHGDIDKFVGDELMAFFEGPEKEINACRAAMQICQAMNDEAKKRSAEGLPVVKIGIGINTGEVVFGSVGARDRMDFTSIGDTVNLAARLEGANKAYGTRSLISEAVYNKAKENFLCREIDLITVKGKNQPVRIYEILAETSQAGKAQLALAPAFEKGLALYRRRDWEKANTVFAKCAEKLNDEASKVYIDRVKHFAEREPEESWDGVFRMTVK
ncbi:MAG: adenylate/guanylate cyclase domain-containing protein [Spirochaetes bacterium]|nr:adenylate/guanylate cyclase domain-containing protein [Spirochaetota bacterium]